MPERTARTALVAARRAAGHTQESLAEALEVDRSTVVRWESGERTPQPHLIPRLARLLGQTPTTVGSLLSDDRVETVTARGGPSPGCAWLATRVGWSPEEVQARTTRVGPALDTEELRPPPSRSAVASVVHDFYKSRWVDGGARLVLTDCDGHRLDTTVTALPGWIGTVRRLADVQSSVQPGGPGALLDEGTADAALTRVVRAERRGSRLFDAPIYALHQLDARDGRLYADFRVASFFDYACTSDLLESELHAAIAAGPTDRLPLRERWLPDLEAVFRPSSRVCAGGVLALCAIARPADCGRPADYALVLQRRSQDVLNAVGQLAVIPKAFHQPLADPGRDVALEATLLREMEEELFGREDVDNTLAPGRVAAPMHATRLSEPMRWLMASEAFRRELTGVGFNLVSGNYEFASLVVVEDEEFWERFGGHIEANWEASSVELVSSRDRAALAEIAQDETWSNEGLFAYLLGLRRLAGLGGPRVDVPSVEIL